MLTQRQEKGISQQDEDQDKALTKDLDQNEALFKHFAQAFIQIEKRKYSELATLGKGKMRIPQPNSD